MTITCTHCGEAEGGHRRALEEIVQHEMIMERAAATILTLCRALQAAKSMHPWLQGEAMQLHAELVRHQAEFENIFHSLVTRGDAR